MSASRKITPWASAAGAAALVLGSVSGLAGTAAAAETAADSAAPAQTGSSISTTAPAATPFVDPATAAKASAPKAEEATGDYKYADSDFILRLRASAAQVEPHIPKPLVPGVGYSAVNLEKEIGGPVAKCEIFGAGAYFTDVLQEGVLENSGPPDAGNKGGGIFNPTESKDTAPNLSPGENLNSRKPGLRSTTDGSRIAEIPHEGNGVHWKAKCDSDAGGKATGNNLDLAGIYGAGSTSSGAVNKATGEYLGVARAYLAGVGPAGMDIIQSFASIKHQAGQKPVIDFRIGVTGATTVSGNNIPYGELTKAFNDAVKTATAPGASQGPTGLTLMGPTESVSENGGRYIINFPFFEAEKGFEARRAGVGQNQKLRLVNIDYEGLFQGAAVKPPGDPQLS